MLLCFLSPSCYSVVFQKTHTLSEDRVEKYKKKDTDDIYLIPLNTKEGKVVMEQSRESKTKKQKLLWQFSLIQLSFSLGIGWRGGQGRVFHPFLTTINHLK